MATAPIWRPTARLLVLDWLDRVLLFSADDPRGRVWFTPGGAIHRGETLASAAIRELTEETGYIHPEAGLGPVVATCAGGHRGDPPLRTARTGRPAAQRGPPRTAAAPAWRA